MKRTLSAPSVKLVFLLRALGGVIGTAVALYVALASIQASVGIKFAIGIAVVTIVVALVMKERLMRRRLKRVAVDERFLYVSNYSDDSEVAIPLSDIVRVSQWRGRTFRPVSIHLRSPSKFGTRIRFQPTPDWGWAFQEDGVVAELRKLAHLN